MNHVATTTAGETMLEAEIQHTSSSSRVTRPARSELRRSPSDSFGRSTDTASRGYSRVKFRVLPQERLPPVSTSSFLRKWALLRF